MHALTSAPPERRARLRETIAGFDHECHGSAIEGALSIAMLCEFVLFSRIENIAVRHDFALGDEVPPDTITFAPQAHIPPYRVDFMLAARKRQWAPVYVVVECDGHDFHERTKEQAVRDRSRDRAIQAKGIPVFRFTGREIWREPNRCAREVFDLLEGALAALEGH